MAQKEMNAMNPFHFYTKLDQTLLLGKKAVNIAELQEGVSVVPVSSIYFHTHRFLHQHHYLSPEPPNDFAYWVTEVLNDAALGEKLSSVDIVQFHRIEDLRKRLIQIIQTHREKNTKSWDCHEGHEFHFMACRTFAFPTPYTALSLKEFREILEHVSINSLYYHIFDAKLRLENNENDFSSWFRGMGKSALADEVIHLDPYTYTLEGLRKRLIVMIKKYDHD
jgi:Family of unknown function (DUF5752)